MNWSAEQQRLLRALGHDLLVHGMAAASTDTHHKLMDAISRAAGGSDVSALIGDIGRLRREPALKRALWPRLRALRRSH